ncbi:MAG: hypothetical protein HQ568_06655 [Calditrichaeota bacterium]|nr:hypothetical protein [Calditrichota bacterium]
MINQFTINLNKGEDIAEREARWRKRREVITLTVLIIFVLVLSMINTSQYQMIEGIIETKEAIIADIDRQLDSLKKTGKNISKDDVLALAKLEKERVLWTKKLLAMGQELPEEMALTFIEYKNNVLLIRFITTIAANEKEFDKVKEMIDKLRASPLFFRDFSEMRLKEQHRADVEDQTILSFSVLCKVSKGSSSSKRGRRSRSSRTASSTRG